MKYEKAGERERDGEEEVNEGEGRETARRCERSEGSRRGERGGKK